MIVRYDETVIVVWVAITLGVWGPEPVLKRSHGGGLFGLVVELIAIF